MAIQNPNTIDEERVISAFGMLPNIAMSGPDVLMSVNDFLAGDEQAQGRDLTSMAMAARSGTLPEMPFKITTQDSIFNRVMDETQNPILAADAARQEVNFNLEAEELRKMKTAATSPDSRANMAFDAMTSEYPESIYLQDPSLSGMFAESFGIDKSSIESKLAQSSSDIDREKEAEMFPGIQWRSGSKDKDTEETPEGIEEKLNKIIQDYFKRGDTSPEEEIKVRQEITDIYIASGFSAEQAQAMTIEKWDEYDKIMSQAEGKGADFFAPGSAEGRSSISKESIEENPGTGWNSFRTLFDRDPDPSSVIPHIQYALQTYDPRMQHRVVTAKALGTAMDRPGIADRVSDMYNLSLGKFVLEIVLDKNNIWGPDYAGSVNNKRYDEWLSDMYSSSPSSIFNLKDIDPDNNYKKLVEVSANINSKEPAYDGSYGSRLNIQYHKAVNTPGWEVAVAQAKGNITGAGIYGKLNKKAFNRLHQQWMHEMSYRNHAEQEGLLSWLATNVGGPWAVDAKETKGIEQAAVVTKKRSPMPPVSSSVPTAANINEPLSPPLFGSDQIDTATISPAMTPFGITDPSTAQLPPPSLAPPLAPNLPMPKSMFGGDEFMPPAPITPLGITDPNAIPMMTSPLPVWNNPNLSLPLMPPRMPYPEMPPLPMADPSEAIANTMFRY